MKKSCCSMPEKLITLGIIPFITLGMFVAALFFLWATKAFLPAA